MLLNSAFGTNRFIAGATVSVDLETKVSLAARDPLGSCGSNQGIFQGDLLVIGRNLGFLVRFRADRAKMVTAVDAMPLSLFLFTKVTFQRSVDVSAGGTQERPGK